MKESPISALAENAPFRTVYTARNGGHSLKGLRMKYPGMDDVVEKIKRIIMTYRGSEIIRDKALDISQALPADPRTGHPDRRNFSGIAKAVHDWIVRNIEYVRDPNGIERIQTPEATLKLRTGDCDDMVILGGALLESLGIPVRLKLIGEKNEFTHIYLEYYADEWITFDPTLALYPGFELPDSMIKKKKTVSVDRPEKPIFAQRRNRTRKTRSHFTH